MRLIITLIAVLLGFAAKEAGAQPGPPPSFWLNEWPDTDFSTTSVKNWTEIMSGGPPKDGIPALQADELRFIPVAQEARIDGREPVIALEMEGEVPRAYPIRYLVWHEIANDVVGGVPVAVTFCPLCNSALVFRRELDGKVLNFGVTGKLRASDMVMYDKETLSWWQQALGEGIVGTYTGAQLEQIPTWLESWNEFASRNPEGLVMDEPAYNRDYGRNPYTKYDSASRPFLFNGEMPPHDIPALMRVVRVGDRAWPMSRLSEEGEIREAGLVISWAAGQASALDTARIGDARDVGTIRVRDADGVDVSHDVMFAFAFNAFYPDGRWMLGE